MAAPTTVSYGGLNLNDGTTFTLLEGFDPGERLKVWDEYRGYDGTVAQANVTEAQLVEMHVRLLVEGTSNSDLNAAVATLNALIDAGEQDFVWDDGSGAVTYQCVQSPRVGYVRDVLSQNKYTAIIDLVLYRDPLPISGGVPGSTYVPQAVTRWWTNVMDYGAVGDGVTDDTAAVQAALTSVGADGGSVYFPVGVYLVSTTLAPLAGTTLIGTGSSSVIKADAALNDNVILVTTDDVTIRDLRFDGNAANQTGGDYTDAPVAATAVDRLSLLDVEIADAYTTALTILGTNGTSTTNVVIRGCRIHDCGDKAIHFSDIDGLVFSENHVYEWALDYLGTSACPGMAIWQGYQGNFRWAVSGNVFTGNATSYYAIESASDHFHEVIADSAFTGNVFDAATGHGNGISGYFFRTAFTGNSHVGGHGDLPCNGYELLGQDVVISGNTIIEGTIDIAGSATGSSRGFLVSGNHVTTSAASGRCICFGSTAGTVSSVSVTGNHLEPTGATGEGITVGWYGTAGVVEDVLVADNIILGGGFGGGTGICLYGDTGCTGIVIRGNVCHGHYYGVGVGNTPYNNADEVTVTGNDLRGNVDNIRAALLGTGTYRIYQNVLADNEVVPDISGARDEPEGALADLIASLATIGLVTDSSTAS